MYLGVKEPAIIKRASEHFNFYAKYPVNYSWPDEISYQNPITGLNSDTAGIWLKLQSGEKTDNTASDDGLKNLNWSKIKTIEIVYTDLAHLRLNWGLSRPTRQALLLSQMDVNPAESNCERVNVLLGCEHTKKDENLMTCSL